MIKEPYKILTDSTLNTYKYIINDVLDKSEEVVGYKNKKGIPGKISKKDIASEIYSYFLAHYYKAIDLYNNENETIINWLNDGCLNIIDIGSNIGTVTFAYIDMLESINKAKNIEFNIIFIEPDKYRCELLEKSISKYIQISKLNIKYHIVNDIYENSIDEIEINMLKSNTIILMSNILNWVNASTWNCFRETLIRNIENINCENGCRVINIEATSPTNSQEKIEKLYGEILFDELTKFCDNKEMPKFENIKECYFYSPRRPKYISNKKYYYGLLIKYRKFAESIDSGYIDIAYNKALYTCRNSFIYDNLEMKYVNLNFSDLKRHIYEIINTGRKSSSYSYQYRMKKSNEKTRPLYIDDFINDIITTTIIISEGLEADKKQNDNISYGNRVDRNMNSPYVFNPYYIQFFNKLKEKEREYSEVYKYYYKIDLSEYYNNVSREKLNQVLERYEELNKEWCNKQINLFINQRLIDCDEKNGLAQGPDISHLLANIYLKEFDDWFSSNFTDVKLLRYVDDIEIIASNKERCEEVIKECKEFLKNSLNLRINRDKNQSGNIEELFTENKDVFFEKVISLTTYILRSLYKLDEKNYKKYINNQEEFLCIYQKCLKKLGIYLSKEWLNIKIDKEVDSLLKIKEKFNNNKKLIKWIEKKKIYDTKLKLGKIPDSQSEKAINLWYYEFESKNKEFIEELNTLKIFLSERLINIINIVKLEEDKANEYKSLVKFIINKMYIFKCMDMSKVICDIENYFPYYNKKVLANYDECYTYVENQIRSNCSRYDSYDYVISIWLLGEYKKEQSLKLLQDIYIQSHNKDEAFINTLATESILKIGKVTDDFIEVLKKKLLQDKKYYYIRNSLLILNVVDNIKDIVEVVERNSFKEERVNIFIAWIKNNIGCNIVNRIEYIRKEYKENYPTYPIDITYISL